VHTAVVVRQIPYERCIQCKTFATSPVMVVVEGCLERWSSTDIPCVIETPKPFGGFRLHCGNITKCFSNRSVCFRSRVEAEFDANPSLLHISHFNTAVRSQNITNMTSLKYAHKHTRSHTWRPIGRLGHKGYSYLAKHKCNTSGFRAAFQFQELVGSNWNNRLWSFRFPCLRYCYSGFRPY
jgi:hypothetical protein